MGEKIDVKTLVKKRKKELKQQIDTLKIFGIKPKLAVMGSEEKGIIIKDAKEAENVIRESKPDIVIVTTMSLLSDVEDSLMICAELGINAITTCEEAFFPGNSNPILTHRLDEMAKKNNCTITGSGYQDIFWGQLITSIAGATQKITKIKGSSSYNVEDYGIALAKAHGAGLSLEEFDKEVASADRISEEERLKIIERGEFAPSYMWSVNGWLAQKLGLTVVSQTQKCVPQTHDKDLFSSGSRLHRNVSAVLYTSTDRLCLSLNHFIAF